VSSVLFVLSVLHHRVVDRIALHVEKRFRQRTENVTFRAAAEKRAFAGRVHAGLQALERVEPDAGTHDEDARVPPVRPRREVLHGEFCRGLFDEAVNHVTAVGQLGTNADITEARVGPRGRHAERGDRTLLGVARGTLQRGLQCGHVCNRVIGRHHDEN
jgi:hypothetical protein